MTICDAADAAIYAGSGETGGGDANAVDADIDVRSPEKLPDKLVLRCMCCGGKSKPSGRDSRCISATSVGRLSGTVAPGELLTISRFFDHGCLIAGMIHLLIDRTERQREIGNWKSETDEVDERG